jgi:hypothetical protein
MRSDQHFVSVHLAGINKEILETMIIVSLKAGHRPWFPVPLVLPQSQMNQLTFSE